MPEQDLPLYPLKFVPIYKEKVWGGRGLEALGRALPGGADTLIGESWELTDLASTTPSDGGGDANRSVVANGPLRERTLHELIQAYGPTLMGRVETSDNGGFPLLLKFLDARQSPSIQIHPSPTYAKEHPEAHLKNEAWYIVDADPDAFIYKGIREGTTPDRFRNAVAANDAIVWDSILIKLPARPGDCHYLPSGTCHGLSPGVLIAEVQTASDTTFRVFDWGRTARELHVEQAMSCIDFGPPRLDDYEKRSHIAGMFTTVTRLVMCEQFRIEKIRMVETYEQELPYDQPAVWMVLEGAGRIDPGNGAETVCFRRGETMLIPANLEQARVMLDEDTVWLEVTFPGTWKSQIA